MRALRTSWPRGGRFVMLVGLDERSVGGDGLAVEAVALRAGRHAGPLPRPGCRSPPRPTRRSRRSSPPPTGTSARRATCSGSSRSATRTRAGSSSTSAGRAAITRSARTSRPASGRPGRAPLRAVRGPRRGRLPAPGRPDPRRRHRARPLPVLRDRASASSTSTPACSSSTAASRSWSRDARSRLRRPIVERACGVCTVTHALAYAQAVERLTGTTVPPRARWARVLLAELERLYNHVGDLGNICAGIGFQPGVSRLGWLKEQLLRANDALIGPPLPDRRSSAPAGSRSTSTRAGLAALPATLDASAWSSPPPSARSSAPRASCPACTGPASCRRPRPPPWARSAWPRARAASTSTCVATGRMPRTTSSTSAW